METEKAEVVEAVLVKPEMILERFKDQCVVRIDTLGSDRLIAGQITDLDKMEINNEVDFQNLDATKCELKSMVKHLETKEIGPLRDAFHKAHKDIVAFQKDKTEAAKTAIATADIKMDNYTEKQNRLRREEEQRIREAQLKKEMAERKRLQDIAAAEAKAKEDALRKQREEVQLKLAEAADANGDRAAADAILAEPIQVETVEPEHVPEAAPAPVFIAPAAPKRKGKRETWDFRVVDASKIPAKFMIPDEVKIRQYVKMHKEDTCPGGEMVMPGIETFTK